MSAEIIDFARFRSSVRAVPKAPIIATAHAGSLTHDFTFWRGASGVRYVHTIYPLHECPELPNANVLLVRKMPGGRAEVMHIGRLENGAACSNLAELRHTAATLGANEVHVHLLGSTADQRAAIESDLSGAGEIAARAH